MPTVLISAPYMLPFMHRFTPILESFGLTVVIPPVDERLEAEDILRYAASLRARSAATIATLPKSLKPVLPN